MISKEKVTGEKDKPIYTEVVLRSRTGTSVMKNVAPLDAKKLYLYQADPSDVDVARKKLTAAGFTVIASSQFGLSIVGSKALYKQYFNTEVLQRPVSMFLGDKRTMEVSQFFMATTPEVPVELANLVDSVYVPPIGYYLAGEGAMPTPSYYHLRPPADISRLTNADAAHTLGIRGTGVKVAMIDSGFVANHDYYAGRGYNITVHAVVGSATQDEVGHGTGIAPNLLAVAPSCEFHFVKMSDGYNWGSLAAFRHAVSLGVKVITCSWGQTRDPVLEAEIHAAVNAGITVVFACGNGCPIGWPGCMPEVISVGGAFPRQDGTWEASSYASSGVNSLYPSRNCPDVCGIVGHGPRGIFIVMPTQMGSQLDGLFSGGHFPNGDETGAADGWLVASGTSSAAPQVAGGAALLLNAKPSLTPAEIKQMLMDTAVDVTTGVSACGTPAGVGPDSATGAGMINLGAAVDRARVVVPCPRAPVIRCLRAPVVWCPRAPLRVREPICYVAPVCTRAPLTACVAGPMPERIPPERIPPEPPEVIPKRESLVPVVVMVPKKTAEAWMAYEQQAPQTPEEAHEYALQAAEEAYCAALEELGMSGEYAGFPSISGYRRGAFNPRATE